MGHDAVSDARAAEASRGIKMRHRYLETAGAQGACPQSWSDHVLVSLKVSELVSTGCPSR